MEQPIPVYAVNLPARTDRRAHIEAQFAGRPEFRLTVVPGREGVNGPWALWQTFYDIVRREAERGTPYFVFCEDDHTFTSDYDASFLLRRIHEADALRADLLSGGMACVRQPVQVSPHLFWVAWFNGMQFTVIFRRAYARILAAQTSEGYVTDVQLSALLRNKFVTFPHISEQREFGYSDATSINAEEGRVSRFFREARRLLQKLDKVRTFYAAADAATLAAVRRMDVADMCLPTYVINLPERTDRRAHILHQFDGRPEFDVRFVEAVRHEVGAVGLWQSIRRVVEQAERDDDDCVLICEDDHLFTPGYDRTRFLHQVVLAGAMGAQLLSGGIGGFGNLVPLGDGLAWVDWLWCTQFIIVYRKAYRPILDAAFSVRDVADGKLSTLLTAKMVTVPFVSRQADFGYSDVTDANNRQAQILRHFDDAEQTLAHYRYAHRRYLAGHPVGEEPLRRPADCLAEPGPHCLQIGCGANLLAGWCNTDVEPTYGALFLDATQPFPLPEGCMDCVVAEHLLDHLSFVRGRDVVRECFRVLRSGGVLRLAVHSTERLAAAYAQPDGAEWTDYARWSAAYYSPRAARALVPDGAVPPWGLVLTNFMQHNKTTVLYDFALLRSLLEAAGFRDVALRPIGQSLRPELQGVDHPDPYQLPAAYAFETLTVEAVKP